MLDPEDFCAWEMMFQAYVGFLEWELFEKAGPELDATILSDDYPPSKQIGYAFTGLYVALCAQDLSGGRASADFTDFAYLPSVDPTASTAAPISTQ